MRWFDAIERITELFVSQQNPMHLPGMWPVIVNARDENLTSDTGFTLGGMSDSLYEYFPKMFALLGGRIPHYQTLYEGSTAAAKQHLFFRPMTPQNKDILISGNARISNGVVELESQGQQLGCFVGGMLGLGGHLFSHATDVELGRKIVDGCTGAYNATTTGVMPEIFHLVPCDKSSVCVWNDQTYADAALRKAELDPVDASIDDLVASERLPPAFTAIGDRRYILRPEAIRSVFYLYRITGDTSLQDEAWKMFQDITKLTETQFTNAAIADITTIDPRTGLRPKDDRMESFWLAETLKYFYLIFSDESLLSLNEWVLNTEAHPFRRPS